MSKSTVLKNVNLSFPHYPEGHITKHFKYSDMLCRGFEKDPCRAKPPLKARLNLELVFRDLAEPFTQYLFSLMIRKTPVVAQSYLCPKCLELRGRKQDDSHAKGLAVDLLFTGLKRVDSLLLSEIALCWSIESGTTCIAYAKGSCLHLELDHGVGRR